MRKQWSADVDIIQATDLLLALHCPNITPSPPASQLPGHARGQGFWPATGRGAPAAARGAGRNVVWAVAGLSGAV